MDYCSSCQRHLNGALVCPGCGAYAPDIAPTLFNDRAVGGGSEDGTLRSAPSTGPGTPQPAPSADLEGAPAAPQGRAARRRQLARWKKNQRRAVVATAVALVGGGLTVATMDRHSTDRAQAATAPEDPGTDAGEEPTGQYTSPASTPPDARRSSPTPPEQAPAAGVPRQRAAAPPPAPRTDTAARPATTPVPAQQPRTASPSAEATPPERTDTVSQQAPAATGGTQPAAQQPNTSTATTSPSEVCLLVLCLG